MMGIPVVEEGPVAQRLDRIRRHVGGEGREEAVDGGWGPDGESPVVRDQRVQSPRHLVGVAGVGDPEVVGKQSRELRRDVTHLGGKLSELFARVAGGARQIRIEKHDGLAVHHSILGSTERHDVDTGIDRERPQRFARSSERGGGVGDSGPIQVDPHTQLVSGVAQRRDLRGGVEGSPFRALRDGENAGLHVVNDAEIVSQGQHLLRRQLSFVRRHVDEFGSEQSFGCSGFVHVDVSAIGAHHRPGGGEKCAEGQNVRARAVPHHQRGDVTIEQFIEIDLGGRGPRIVAVGGRVPVVTGGQRIHDRRMDAGVVVAGEPMNG